MKRLLSCLIVCALLLFGTMPCQAVSSPAPPYMPTFMEELLRWYSGLSGDALQECVVTTPVVCKGEILLGATPCRADVTFFGGLRVSAGAKLIVDNPNLVLMGFPPVITVEPGGILHIRRWNALVAQAMPKGGIVVQEGGKLLMDAGITLPDGVVIDQNPPPNKLPPPSESMPDAIPENGTVLVVWDLDAHQIKAGDTLEGLPQTVEIQAGRKTISESIQNYNVGVQWDTASVDCGLPGTYEITGTLDSEELTALGLTNPNHLQAKLMVVVQKQNPITTLSVQLMSIDERYMRLRLKLPLLPDDVTALYLERETAPDVWERLAIPRLTDNDGNPETNFLAYSQPNPPNQFIVYVFEPPVPQVRLRVTVEGSVYAGISNEVVFLAQGNGIAGLPTPKPEGQPSSDDNDDDGSSGGNRGGGGQGTTDREEDKETAIPKPEESAEGAAQVGSKTSAGTANAETPPVSVTAPQETASTAQSTAEQPPAIVSEEAALPAQANPPAQNGQDVSEQSKPLGSSARNWQVFAATLALCGAIWIFTIKRKKS